MTAGAFFLGFLEGGRAGASCCRDGALEVRRKTEGMEMEVGGEDEGPETSGVDVGGEES